MDQYFRVEVITATQPPARAIWYGMHQCVCENFALEDQPPSTEQACGEAIVKHLLPVGHWSPLEHAAITFNFGGFSHRVMQQFTRSRVGVSPSVQSFRYTGNRIARLGEELVDFVGDVRPSGFFQPHCGPTWMDDHVGKVEELFYVRPVGRYRDRSGADIDYTKELRRADLLDCAYQAFRYAQKSRQKMPAEQAAGGLPMDARQDWVATFNVRSLCGFFDRRTPKDAQLEIRQLCDLMWPHFETWLPPVAAWYRETRWGKNKLAP